MEKEEPKIVIGVPGAWKDRSDIVTSIVERSGGYLFAGMVLMNTGRGDSFEVEIYDHDPAVYGAVKSGGMRRIPDEDLEKLHEHTYTLYLLSDETGRGQVEKIVDAVAGLLDAGGIVAKIESAGFSVSAEQFREYANNKAAYNLYRAMVTLVSDKDNHFTCGMKAFDLPDCEVVGADLDTAFELATEFCCYMIDESPTFADGHTFSISEGATKYKLALKEYTFYPEDNLFHNPRGVWELTPIE